MPELPEVETVARTLGKSVLGRRIDHVQLRRAEVVRGGRDPSALLAGQRIVDVKRHGKQLALLAENQRVACIHLGMSGRLLVKPSQRGSVSDDSPAPHTHVLWTLAGNLTLAFNDPRRFGGIWCFPSLSELYHRRWGRLGEDALTITPARLHERLQQTTRAIKVALLDQNLIAGLGNIYVDELLFTAGLHPLTPANRLSRPQVRGLIRRIRRLLGRAVEAGGSTVRDYVSADGWAGDFQTSHRVYGRADQPCRRCARVLQNSVIGGRTATWCAGCQTIQGH